MTKTQSKLLREIDRIALALLVAVNVLLYSSLFWLHFLR